MTFYVSKNNLSFMKLGTTLIDADLFFLGFANVGKAHSGE
jgi:hypothetical protein